MKKKIWQIPFLLLLIIGTIVILKKQPPFRTNEGLVFGTVYKITYQHAEDLQNDIKQAMMEVDQSLSPYNPASIITRINHNQNTTLNEHFTQVFELAQKDFGRNGRGIRHHGGSSGECLGIRIQELH